MTIPNDNVPILPFLHSSMPDRPNTVFASTAAFKAALDSSTQALQAAINALVADLQASGAGVSAAEFIGSAPIAGLSGSTVYNQITDAKSQLNGVVLGQIPDLSLTTNKYADFSVTFQKLEATLQNELTNLERIAANLVAIAEIQSQSIGQSGYGFDLFFSTPNTSSAARIDTALPATIIGATTIGATSISIRFGIAPFTVGQEVTLQDVVTDTVREKVVIQSITGNVLTLTTPVVNTYADKAVVYRSNQSIDTTSHELDFGAVRFPDNFAAMTKLANPTLPQTISAVNGVKFSPSSTYLALGTASGGSSEGLAIYKRSGDTFTKLTPVLMSNLTVVDVDWSPDETYVAGAFSSSVRVHKRAGDVFTPLPDLTGATNVNDVAFSPNGTYLSAALGTSPFVLTWKRTGDTFTPLSNPASLPAGSALGCAWSSDSQFLAIAHGTTPFVTIYQRSGDTFTKLADPTGGLPASTGQCVCFSPDTNYMTVGHAGTPFFSTYKRTGTAFAKIADPASLPSSATNDVSWSADSNFVTLAVSSSPFMETYSRSGDVLTKIAAPGTLPLAAANSTHICPNDEYVAVGFNTTTPYFHIYKNVLTKAVTQQDVRYNIVSPFGGVDEVRSWIRFDKATGFTVTSALSIVAPAANESFTAMTADPTDFGTEIETYFDGFVTTANTRATQRITMLRALTADDVSINKYLSALITP